METVFTLEGAVIAEVVNGRVMCPTCHMQVKPRERFRRSDRPRGHLLLSAHKDVFGEWCKSGGQRVLPLSREELR